MKYYIEISCNTNSPKMLEIMDLDIKSLEHDTVNDEQKVA